MRETFILIRKDFAIGGKAIFAIMALAAVALANSRGTELLAVLLFFPVLAGMIFFAIDPPDSLAVFALPGRRAFLPVGRYVSVAITGALSLAVYAFLAVVTHRSADIRAVSLISAAAAFSVSIMFPLYYRLPQKWALGITAFVMMMIASVTVSIALVAADGTGTIPASVETLWSFRYLPLVLAVVSVALYSVSLVVSVKMLLRKVV